MKKIVVAVVVSLFATAALAEVASGNWKINPDRPFVNTGTADDTGNGGDS